MTKHEIISKLIDYLELHKDADEDEIWEFKMHSGICFIAMEVFGEDIYEEEWVVRLSHSQGYIGGKSIKQDPVNGIPLRIKLLKEELENDKNRLDPRADCILGEI